MSGKRRGWWSDSIPLLGQQSNSKSHPHRHQNQPLSLSSFSLSSPTSPSAVYLEMTSPSAAGDGDGVSDRSVFLGVDVGTGSARAGLPLSHSPVPFRCVFCVCVFLDFETFACFVVLILRRLWFLMVLCASTFVNCIETFCFFCFSLSLSDFLCVWIIETLLQETNLGSFGP